MEQGLLPTEFAPAERSPQSEIKRQSGVVSESSLVRLLDYIPDIVLVLNPERQVVFANKAAASLFNIDRVESAYGSRPGELLDCIHSHESEGGCGTTEFCRECGAARAMLSSLRGEEDIQECRITQKESGDSLDLRVWAYPVTMEDKPFAVFVLTDIGNEKRKNVLERIFLHDIMNTVGNIHSFAEILKDAEPAEIEEFRDIIHDLSLRLIDEINAHRELVAAENNDLTVHPETLDSMSLLNDVITRYSRTAAENECSLSVSPDAQKVEFTSDRVLLSRVLGNMVKNALEASTPGSDITLGCRRADNEIEFSVHNPGYIPRTVQLQIFQRSFSTKGSGRGLGTYGMRLLSERYLKGSISFISSEEEGTTFTARYPLTAE